METESEELDEHLKWLESTLPGFSYRCLLDEHWTMLRLTEGIEAMTGFPVSDFLKNEIRTYASVIHPEDRAAVTRGVREAVQRGESFYLDYRLITRDGQTRWVSERGKAHLREDQVEWLDGHIVDQTELERMRLCDEVRREDLRRQQAALVTLATSEAVASGALEEASRLATKIIAKACGVERVSVWILNEEKTSLDLVQLYKSKEQAHEGGASLRASDYPSYFGAMNTGRLIDAHDARADSRTREFATSYLEPLGITSMLDVALRVSGDVVGALCLEHVGPKRTWSDYEIQFAGEVADQLAHALLNREKRLAQARETDLQNQLFFSQKMEAVGQLAGSVAHDFNNLLTIISGFAEELQATLPDGPAQEDLEEICKAARQGTELTAQLLSMSRRDDLELTDLDVVEAVRELTKVLPKMLGDDIVLSIDVPPEPVVVRSSSGLTQQILTNLIANAGHAMDDRGTVTVKVEAITLSVPLEVAQGSLPPGGYALLQVSDTGTGMTEEVQSRIFDPFFTTKPQGSGTGLGLSTVYNILGRSSGGIRVSSTLGMGSTFSVYLPLSGGAAAAVTPSRTAARRKEWADGMEFLIVEDNEAVLGVMHNALARVGARVTTATRPDEAIAKLESWEERAASGPHLILTDMGMPGGGGSRVIDWVKSNRPEIPIAVVSGYVSENQTAAIEGLQLLRKPFLGADLQDFALGVLQTSEDAVAEN